MGKKKKPKMMHSTYFTLPMDATPALRDSFMESCTAYLSQSEGMLSFWVAEMAQDIFRTKNDRNFHISMNQVFENQDMFDIYNSNDTDHNQFVIEVNRWAANTGRRVMDSYLTELDYKCGTCEDSSDARLLHNVYFSLTDNSKSAKKKFIKICQKLLSDHPGICVFAIGELANLKRDVSISNYDVAMNIVWDSKASYTNYLSSAEHEAFYPATQGMVKDTYVFDSYLADDVKLSY